MAVCIRIALALTIVGTAIADTLVFDAENCNVNLDNMNNWEGNNPVSGKPGTVAFGSPSASEFRSVNARVNSGSYTMNMLQLENDMVLTLAPDGVMMEFSDDADESTAYFIGGQEATPECSISCTDNLLSGTVQDASVANYTTLSLSKATSVPCSDTDLIIPRGYNVMLYAWGFHSLRRLIMIDDDGTSHEITDLGSIPQYTFYPPDQSLKFGADALAFCTDHGLLSSGLGSCMCQESCVASGPSFVDDVIDRANQTVEVVTDQARKDRTRLVTNKVTRGYAYDFMGVVGSGARADSVADLQTCMSQSDALDAQIRKYLPNASTLDGSASVTVRGTGSDTAGGTGTLSMGLSITGPETTLMPFPTTMAVMPFDTPKVQANATTQLLFAIWTGIAAHVEGCASLSVGTRAWQTSMGMSVYSTTLYVGSNMPEILLPYYINDANKADYAEALADGLDNSHGIYKLSRATIEDNLEIMSAQQVYTAQGGRQRRDLVGYGMATSRIAVQLSFEAYAPVTDGSQAHDGLTALANSITALFELDFGGVCSPTDHSCIEARAKAIVDEQFATMQSTDGVNPGDMTDAEEASQKQKARDAVHAMYVSVFGDCGPLGYANASVCVDPSWDAAVRAEADEVADARFATQQTEAEDLFQLSSTPVTPVVTTTDNGNGNGNGNNNAGASTGGDGDDNGNLIIIIVAVVAVCTLLIIVVLIITRRKGSQAAEKQHSGTVAFENPMYDSSVTDGASNTGLYDDVVAPPPGDMYDDPTFDQQSPVYDDGDEENLDGFDNGYLDVSDKPDTGYLDVDGKAEDGDAADDFDDDDDDDDDDDADY